MLEFDDRAVGYGKPHVPPRAGVASLQPCAAPDAPEHPQSAADLGALYPNEVACRRYLEQLRWGSGFRCPHCGSAGEPWRSSLALVACAECRQLSSAVTGTVLHGSSRPLALWFRAAWDIASRDAGVAIGTVQRTLGLPTEAAAWACLEQLASAMVQYQRDRLGALVEVDECYARIALPGTGARRELRRVIVAVALELVGGRVTRVRLRAVSGERLSSLAMFVAEVVTPGTPVCTDGLRAYASLRSMGYDHVVTHPNAVADPATVALPNVARFVPLLQRWLDDTGPIPLERLGYYLDELSFRFNERTRARAARGLLFRNLLCRIVGADDPPLTTAALVPAHRSARTSSGVREKTVATAPGEGTADTAEDASGPPSAASVFAAAAGRYRGRGGPA
ncbi:MAG: IS1595 family transposase [Polyangiaceae bacterium]|nr:IS1595 family transposase [Polyangiaceae bacterium]